MHCLPGLLGHIPEEVNCLAKDVELNLVFEVVSNSWPGNMLDLPLPPFDCGFYEGRDFLRRSLPDKAWEYFQKAHGIYFAMYGSGLGKGLFQGIYHTVRGIRKLKPHVLHLDGESLRAALWAPLIKSKLVINVHEPVLHAGSGSFSLTTAKKMLINRADHLVVHSEEARKILVANFSIDDSHISCAPMGPEDVITAWSGKQERQEVGQASVVFFGWLSPRKGIDVMLKAVPEVARMIPGVKFIIAGQPGRGYQLPAEVENLKNAGVLEVIPRHLTNPELANLMAKASVVLLPYREARQSAVVLTAYAFRKPVITSDLPGLREQVWHDKTGLLFREGDSNDLTEKLVYFLSHKELLRQYESNILNMTNTTLNWRRFREVALSAYSRLCVERA